MKSIRKQASLVLALCLLLGLTACTGDGNPTNHTTTTVGVVTTTTDSTTTVTGTPSTTTTVSATTATSATTAATVSTSTVTATTTTSVVTTATPTRPTLAQPSGDKAITSSRYRNSERIGDWGGPAYAVHSQKGYNHASIDVELSDVEINMVRKSDGKYLVGYLFLAMNIYDAEGGYWVNCLDAGLQYDSPVGSWRLFYFINNASDPNQPLWYTSDLYLDSTHDYRIILDCSKTNHRTTLTAYDLTEGKVADSVEFQSRWSLKDGSNVDFVQDYAIDMPENTMYDLSGNKHQDIYLQVSDQIWKEVILYNSNEGIYMRNVKITNARLNNEPWTEGKTRLRGFSPDRKQADIGYDVVKVSQAKWDSEFRIDFDLQY